MRSAQADGAGNIADAQARHQRLHAGHVAAALGREARERAGGAPAPESRDIVIEQREVELAGDLGDPARRAAGSTAVVEVVQRRDGREQLRTSRAPLPAALRDQPCSSIATARRAAAPDWPPRSARIREGFGQQHIAGLGHRHQHREQACWAPQVMTICSVV